MKTMENQPSFNPHILLRKIATETEDLTIYIQATQYWAGCGRDRAKEKHFIGKAMDSLNTITTLKIELEAALK